MGNYKNEKGYTLLLTLVLILILIIFFSTVAFSASNQQLQVEHTDSSLAAVANAEMGIEYYRALIIEMTYDQRIVLEKELKANEMKKPPEIEDRKKIEDRNYQILINNINKLLTVPNVNSLYKLIEVNANSSSEETKIKVEGIKNNKSKRISATFFIPKQMVVTIKDKIGGGGNPDSNIGFLIEDIEKPTAICKNLRPVPCTSNNNLSLKDIKNAIVFFPNKSQIGNNANNGSINSTLYFEDNVSFEKVSSGNSLNIKSLGKGNITFSKHVSLHNSKIESNGLLSFESPAANEGKGKKNFSQSIIVTENLTITQKPNDKDSLKLDDSKLCIKNLKKQFNLNILNDVELVKSYVYLLVDNKDPKKNKLINNKTNMIYVDAKDFSNQCSLKSLAKDDYEAIVPNVDNFTKDITYHK